MLGCRREHNFKFLQIGLQLPLALRLNERRADCRLFCHQACLFGRTYTNTNSNPGRVTIASAQSCTVTPCRTASRQASVMCV